MTPVVIKNVDNEVFLFFFNKYFGVFVDNRLDWKKNISAIFKNVESRLFFLRKLCSFSISRSLLYVFYQSILASTFIHAVVCLDQV